MHPIRLKSVLAGILMAGSWALAGLACAQYVWLDDGGRKQYSDMPPPPSVPATRILKTPRAAPAAAPAPAASKAESGSESGGGTDKAKAPPTLAEKNAEFIKRRTERAEQEKKDAEQRRLASEKAKSCERARQYQKTLAAGTPITSINQNGERVFLDDAQRAQEQRDTSNALKACE